MTAPAGAGPVAERIDFATIPISGSTYVTISASAWPALGEVVADRTIGPLPSISSAIWAVWSPRLWS
jgi:hypothetical protein